MTQKRIAGRAATRTGSINKPTNCGNCFMHNQMNQVSVFLTERGEVSIKQEMDLDEPAYIVLRPEQIELFIKWLRCAAKEARAVTEGE